MSNPCSVLFLSTSVGFGNGSDYGGGEHFASEFIQELCSRGWDVTLVCPPRSPMWRDKRLMSAVHATRCLDIAATIKNPSSFLSVAFRWLLFSRAFGKAVVYANGYEAMKWAVAAKLLWKQRVICHLHESTYGAYSSKRARFIAPHVDHFLAISQDVCNRFATGSGTPPENISVIHNGVPVSVDLEKSPTAVSEIRSRNGIPIARPCILMVARTDPQKGHSVLVDAASVVTQIRNDVIFFIAGLQDRNPSEASIYNAIRAQIRNLKLENAIRYIGYTPDARELMRASNIVVVPSTAEGFGRTAIEAMAEGTPVIASKVGGLAEIIDHGKNGLHFAAGNAKALAKEILFLLDNPDKARQLAENGRTTALARFSTSAMTDKIETLLLGRKLGHRIS